VMSAVSLLSLVAVFQTTDVHYEVLSSVHFHNQLRLAERDEADGVVVAFVDETAATFDAVVREYNSAAATFSCLAKGGVYIMHAGVDARAKFLAANFALDYDIGSEEPLELPFAAHFVAQRPTAWNAGNNFTSELLTTWAYSAIGVTLLEDGNELAAFETTTPQFAIGVFADGLCASEAQPLRKALELLRKGPQHARLPVAMTTNLKLAEDLVPGSLALPGIYAVLGQGSRLRYPSQLPKEGAQIAEWLSGLASSHAKDEV